MAEENNSETFLNPSRRSYVYENTNGSDNKKRVILIIVGIVILLALVALAVVATGGKGEGNVITPTPQLVVTPTSIPTQIPTPVVSLTPTLKVTPTSAKTTPTPTPKVATTPGTSSTVDKASGLDRANLKIIVQNGGGVAGAATKGSDILKKLGYDVVSSGNADNFDYSKTTIQVKSTKKTYLDLLKKDLSTDYTIGAFTSDYTGTDADAVVIIGKE